MPIRIAIVEDDDDIRKLTASVVNFYEDLECVGSFADAETFLRSLPALRPDVVLMDIGLPGMDGIACVGRCKDPVLDVEGAGRDAELVMLTNHADNREVFEAIRAGATGYVLKGGTPEQLAAAIRDVVAGGSPMSRQISRMVMDYYRPQGQVPAEPAPPETPGPLQGHQPLEELTEQENVVLDLLGQGLAYKEIAGVRHVSEHTVRTQVRSIYRKLQVHSRTAALNKRTGKR